jgi:hypothetical protein
MSCKKVGISGTLTENLGLHDLKIFPLPNLQNKFCESGLEEDGTQTFRQSFNDSTFEAVLILMLSFISKFFSTGKISGIDPGQFTAVLQLL